MCCHLARQTFPPWRHHSVQSTPGFHWNKTTGRNQWRNATWGLVSGYKVRTARSSWRVINSCVTEALLASSLWFSAQPITTLGPNRIEKLHPGEVQVSSPPVQSWRPIGALTWARFRIKHCMSEGGKNGPFNINGSQGPQNIFAEQNRRSCGVFLPELSFDVRVFTSIIYSDEVSALRLTGSLRLVPLHCCCHQFVALLSMIFIARQTTWGKREALCSMEQFNQETYKRCLKRFNSWRKQKLKSERGETKWPGGHMSFRP